LVVAGSCILLSDPVADAASNWMIHVAASSQGRAKLRSSLSRPTSVASTCAAPTTSKTIKVTWTAVTRATNYSVYYATTSASGTCTLTASGVATTSWTSGALTTETNCWYEVTVIIGTHWTSVKSSASGESTINGTNPFCVHP
jgi:hypothetical protein